MHMHYILQCHMVKLMI